MASRESKPPRAPKAPHDDNGLRRQGREAAVQVLYASAPGSVKERIADNHKS